MGQALDVALSPQGRVCASVSGALRVVSACVAAVTSANPSTRPVAMPIDQIGADERDIDGSILTGMVVVR